MQDNGQESGALPSTTEESVKIKLLTYLLNPDHPKGKHKARWFLGSLGFTIDNYEGLARQVLFDQTTAVEAGTDRYGTRYEQRIMIQGANGNNTAVRFAWIRNTDGVVRLVTAVPDK